MKIRTRFAPSPTGLMHIGNLRTAIYEYLLAKHENGDFILRIEDTDQERKVDGAIDFIYNTLKLCHINVDEGPNNAKDCGPYIQSERKGIYIKYAEELINNGSAYYCFCTEKRLEELRKTAEAKNIPFMYDGCCKKYTIEEAQAKIADGEKYVIRQAMPKYGESEVMDELYGKIKVQNKILEDQILLKSDGFPTYNFANVVDDHLMGITHVMRGNEYLSQTPKYNLLYQAFGWEAPKYIHVSMVLGEDGNKLSKRNGDASFMDLYHEGFLPEAIVNYLVLLGWSPSDNNEVMNMDELIQKFDYHKISKSPSSYDKKKLAWMNAIYLKKMSSEEFINYCQPYLNEAYDVSNKSSEWINTLLLTYQNHISYGKEIGNEVSMFFNDQITITKEMKEVLNEDTSKKVVKCYQDKLINLKKWTIENIKKIIAEVKEETGEKGKMLYMPIRILVSGSMHGPELENTIYLIGYEKVVERLK